MDFCKPSNCDYVFPILETECIGNSLSTINLNFRELDIAMCNVENDINTTWNPAFTTFSILSAQLLDAYTVTSSNSSCWQQTFNTVQELSGFWLKPITLIYPHPFTPAATDSGIIQTWLNENFPVKNGDCLNYIVGQQVIVHSPEYLSINRIVSNSQSAGTRVAVFTYSCDCIGRGSYSGEAISYVDCGGVTINLTVPDQFINNFVGLEYTVQPDLTWGAGNFIFR